MNSQKDVNGRLTLAGTLSKLYLPKECIDKPSKWATFYSLLADKHINVNNG